MRAIVTADLHCHAKRLHVYDKLMKDLMGLALYYNCPYVIVAGDLWDEKHTINSDVYNMIYLNLERSRQQGVLWILLRGNHEITVKSDPHNTMLRLYSKVARVINRPTILATKGGDAIAFAPWYLHDRFIPIMRKMTQKVRRRYHNAVLIAHIGLDEGQLSASNYYRVPQRVAVNHLYPDDYRVILLGDYHMQQDILDNCFYLGCPIPHGFGDGPTQGAWLLELEDQFNLNQISLSYTYPQFYTHVVQSPLDLAGIDFDSDFHKIRVSPDLRHLVDRIARQANVTVEDVLDKEREVTIGRLEGLSEAIGVEEVFEQFCKLKELSPTQYKMGMTYLTKAKEKVYGRG